MLMRDDIRTREAVKIHTSDFNIDALKSLPVAIYICDQYGKFTYYNDAAADLWGQAPLYGSDYRKSHWKVFDLDGMELPRENWPLTKALHDQSEVDNLEVILERPDGSRVFVRSNPKPLFDKSGNFCGIINMLSDISEAKAKDEEFRKTSQDYDILRGDFEKQINDRISTIQKSEERYHKMIEEVEDYAILLLDRDGTILNWNKGAEKIKGYKESEIIWKNFRTFYLQEDRNSKLPERLIHEAATVGKAAHEGWRVRKDGTKFWGSTVITSLHDKYGNVIGFSKVTRDLTARKHAEDQLREYALTIEMRNSQLERYHKMVEEVEDYAILMLDRTGSVLNWNKGAEKIKGYKESEIVGQNFSIFYLPEDRQRKLPETLIETAKRTGKANHEGWRLRKNGTRFWGNIVITALHDEHRNVIGFSKVTRDLTERKIVDDQLRNYARDIEFRNKQLEEYAYIASHDLQEPLRKIQIFADLLQSNLDDEEAVKKHVSKINSAADRMATLIKEVLKYSQLSTQDQLFSEVDLNEVLENVQSDFDLLISEKNVTLNISKLPVINGIAIQLHQLFSNLINNSIKFSEQQPVISISARPFTGEVSAFEELDSQGKYFEILFTDNGIGFEQQHAHMVFRMFKRLGGVATGSGIGLAMCKKIVENHHGMIDVTSQPGKGTTFRILFPVFGELLK